MDYTLFRMEYYNLHIIKTDKFKTVSTKVVFKKELEEKEMTLRNMLINILLQSNKKYKTRREMEIESENLYGITLGSENIKSGKYGLTIFSETFLNEKYTEKGMNKRSLNFLLDIIFEADISDFKFNKDSYNISKRIVKDEIKSIKDNPNSYAKLKLYKLINKNNPLSFYNKGSLEELRKITNKKLYKFYLDLINNSIVDIFIIGDVDIEEVKKIFDTKMKYKKSKIEDGSHYLIEYPSNNIIKREEEVLNINQSCLYMGFTFDDLSEFELKYVLNIYSFILGGGGESLLFSSVREENSLCYYINSSYIILSRLLIINAGIESSKADMVIELVKEALEKMKKCIKQSDLDKAKKTYKSSCLEMYDSPNSILNLYISMEYLKSDSIDDKIKNIDKVTIDDVISLANKIHLEAIFLLKGEEL